MDKAILTQQAIRAARAAGTIIQNHMHKPVVAKQKETGGNSYASQVVTIVDKKCESIILSHLSAASCKYDLAILSEETKDDGSRFEKDFFWCIDPLDGTLSFINQEPGFSVSIALIAKDGTPQIGVVFDPSTNHMYHAIRKKGAFKDEKPWELNNVNDYLTYVTDRKLKDTPRRNEIDILLGRNMQQLGLKRVKEIAGGGAVINAIRVLENGPACMLKFPKKEKGGGSIWDYAASACIFQELGLPATQFNGRKLNLNKKESTFMNDEGMFYGNFRRQ